MEVERGLFISGEDILKRWKGAPFQLVNAMLSGELVAVDKDEGFRHGADNDRCFYCDAPLTEDGFTICFTTDDRYAYGVHYLIGDEDDEVFGRYCGEMSPGPTTMTPKLRSAYRIERALQSDFYTSEVEAYEQAHGLGPLPEKPEEPSNGRGQANESGLSPEERQELGRLRLEKEKWDTSIKASMVVGRSLTPGKRFTKKEIWKILSDSGIHGSDLPDTVFSQIWASIPTEFRNTGGRPKTGDAADF